MRYEQTRRGRVLGASAVPLSYAPVMGWIVGPRSLLRIITRSIGSWAENTRKSGGFGGPMGI